MQREDKKERVDNRELAEWNRDIRLEQPHQNNVELLDWV
jgi:hypothetical protein